MKEFPLKVLDLDDRETREKLAKLFSRPLVRVEFNCGACGYIPSEVADGFIKEHYDRCGCEGSER